MIATYFISFVVRWSDGKNYFENTVCDLAEPITADVIKKLEQQLLEGCDVEEEPPSSVTLINFIRTAQN